VVLPDPEGPMITVCFPGGIDSEIFFRTQSWLRYENQIWSACTATGWLPFSVKGVPYTLVRRASGSCLENPDARPRLSA
jgi:hypothetical protein